MLELPPDLVLSAMSDPTNCLGPLSPTVRAWVVATVGQHNVLSDEERTAVMLGEA